MVPENQGEAVNRIVRNGRQIKSCKCRIAWRVLVPTKKSEAGSETVSTETGEVGPRKMVSK